MKTLPLNALRAFAAVYETGGVRPAARLLAITHSSVSRHLQELEAWMDIPLLEKQEGVRRLGFTAEGEKLGREVLASMSHLESAVLSLKENQNPNTVIIETISSIAVRWLLPRLASMDEKGRRLEISVLVDQRRKSPEESGADLSLRMGKGPWKDVDCFPLMSEILRPVMSPAYWENNGKPADLEALNQLKLLHDRDANLSWKIWQGRYQIRDLDTRSGPRFTSSDLVLRAAEQGLGVALAPARLAEESLNAGTLIAPFLDCDIEIPDFYWLILQKEKKQRLAVRQVMEWLAGKVD